MILHALEWLGIAIIAVLIIGCIIFAIWMIGASIRSAKRSLNENPIADLREKLCRAEETIQDFTTERDKILDEVIAVKKDNDRIRKAWKPDNGVYCSCIVEDNHNPSVLQECGYHQDIREGLGVGYAALLDVRNYLLEAVPGYVTECSETETEAPEGEEEPITDNAIRRCQVALDALHEVVKAAHDPTDQPEVEGNCEICHVHSDQDKTIRQRFIPTNLCQRCADKDVIIIEDDAPRETNAARVNWHTPPKETSDSSDIANSPDSAE